MAKNGYFTYNLPLQVWPEHENPEDEKSPVTDCRILNYMPRKERTSSLQLSDLLGEQPREEFFEDAAKCYENMARMMRECAKDPSYTVYYHDSGMVED